MKVWIVMQTSYSPCYNDDTGYRESKSVVAAFDSEDKAVEYVKAMTPKQYSPWSSEYEVEDFDVR